ncbi:MAG: 3-phosphoshikimate 1-carboxyvinyltransferase [Candidatus Methylacidiphilales bacterium]|nr:3-phosphoshikimate 1-carboxyvinyltransferase [Candidatus Methylacidiphilales bacterium]
MHSPSVSQIEIPHHPEPIHATVSLPGSKSITNRALLTAALADGETVLENALFSEDTDRFSQSLEKLGFAVTSDASTCRFTVRGLGGKIPAAEADLFFGNAGTAARLLPCMVALGKGKYRMDGIARMRQRPMADLLDVLAAQGSAVDFEGQPGHFPCTIHANGIRGGHVSIRADKTSQQLSALLMTAPYFSQDTVVEIDGGLVSRPYVEMTLRLMKDFGIEVLWDGGKQIHVKAGQRYTARRYAVEPDASGASYFFAAAALTGGCIRVEGLGLDSAQGDIHFVRALEKMGCDIHEVDGGVEVTGPKRLRGIDIDMNGISDTVMSLAAIAPFADGPTTITNVTHIRHKETDRIVAVATELRRMGIQVEEFEDGLRIFPGTPHAAAIETYDDHRMAMSFAVTGLRVPGLIIRDPGCTAKTFPDFFDRFFRALGNEAVPA